ncbi:MAG: hypothetical protein WBW04_05125 [Nitrolancea sp.]
MTQRDGALRSESRDISAALEAIRSAVRRNAGYVSAGEVPESTSTSTMVSELADLAAISAHLPVTWSTPVVGRFLAIAKRGTRILLRWYINPIVEQQNYFNDAVVKAIAALDERQRDIERRLTANQSDA